jgi:hypothetical protein
VRAQRVIAAARRPGDLRLAAGDWIDGKGMRCRRSMTNHLRQGLLVFEESISAVTARARY